MRWWFLPFASRLNTEGIRTPGSLGRRNHLEYHTVSDLIISMKEVFAMGEDDTAEASWWSPKDALVEAEHGLPDLPSVLVQDWVSKNLPTYGGRRERHRCTCSKLKRTIRTFQSYSGSIMPCVAEPTEQLRRQQTIGGAPRQQKWSNT